MVYQGPSRGCNSCRQRRKKCDETRPSCLRCTKANRTCGGYEDGAFSAYHRRETRNANQTSTFTSLARKCSLPPRLPIPGTDILPNDIIPTEASEEESNSLSLRAFFYDYCLTSANKTLSRGFLSGLEMMVRRSGQTSSLAKACEAVSFASHGQALRRPMFIDKAALFYHELLGSLAAAIEDPGPSNTAESQRIAMMLGLYQIAICSQAGPSWHDTHAKGLAALMNTGHSPLHLVSKFSVPALGDGGESLADLLLSLDSLWTKYEASHHQEEDLTTLRSESNALNQRFISWQTSRRPEFNSTTIGYVDHHKTALKITAGFWPGRVDSYFDLYVAAMWNIFRAARLLLVALILKLTDGMSKGYADGLGVDYSSAANTVIEDMVASIPYHLAENLQVFLGEQAITSEIRSPGPFLGGLLLMHPLHIAFRMPFLPRNMREYMRDCLLWIGSRMGIGQATVLAEAPYIDKNYIASSCMIIWSGFLG